MSGSEWIVGECGPARWFPSQHQIFPCLLLTDGFHSQRKVRCLGGGGCREESSARELLSLIFSESRREPGERLSLTWSTRLAEDQSSEMKAQHHATSRQRRMWVTRPEDGSDWSAVLPPDPFIVKSSLWSRYQDDYDSVGRSVLRYKQPSAGGGTGQPSDDPPWLVFWFWYFQSIEDFILLVGTSVAFVAFILWCCFPIEPKDSLGGSEHLSTQVTTLQSTVEPQSWSSDGGRGVRRQVQAAGPEPRVQEDGGRAGAGPVRDEHLIAASTSSHCCVGCCLEEQFSQDLFTFLK